MAGREEILVSESEEVERFIQVVKQYFGKENRDDSTAEDVDAATTGGAESTDEVDGICMVSADLNATLPLGVVPELFIGKTPVSNTQKISNERYADITATPIDDAELGRLKEAEEKVLKGISGYNEIFDFEITDVEIANGVKIHTACFHRKPPVIGQESLPPIVMLHGTGGGIPCFHMICGELVQKRRLYAIDIPGFGSSSRVNFSNNVGGCEDQLIRIIEIWREKMKLDTMVLFGHSLGGYVCAIYAINYYEHVSHLVLMDSWGILSKEEHTSFHGFIYELARIFFEKSKANPVKYLPNLGHTLGGLLVDVYMSKSLYGESCMEYFRRAITAGEMSGMKALLVLSDFQIDYPVLPLKKRLIRRLGDIVLPITFLYGENSPYKNLGGDQVKNLAKGHVINVKYVEKAGHHVHVENPKELVKHLLDLVIND